MYDPEKPVWHTVELGPMPVRAVAKLGITVEPGTVMFFHHAMKHTFQKIPERRKICWPYIGLAIRNPTHIGQQPGYEQEAFDLVHASGHGLIILVSVLLKPTKRFPTAYAVTSVYPFNADSLARRIRLGTTIKL